MTIFPEEKQQQQQQTIIIQQPAQQQTTNTEGMRYCSSCGKQIKKEVAHCEHCGSKQE